PETGDTTTVTVRQDPDGALTVVSDETTRSESPFGGLHNEPAPPLKPLRPMTSDELSKIVGELPELDLGYRAEIYGTFFSPKIAAERHREYLDILRLQEAVGPEAAARARVEARTTTKPLRECLRDERDRDRTH